MTDEKKINVSVERNRDAHPEDMTTPLRGTEKNFNLVVDSVPYLVHAAPFDFNGETRYRVSVNDNEEHISPGILN